MSEIVLIAALAKNGVIGGDNKLLWRLKSDMKHFRGLTMGRPLIIGRKTWDSIGRPLPGRQMIVITRNPDFVAEGVMRAASPEEALRIARALAASDKEAIFVAGGGEVYAAFMPLADRLEITSVDLEPEGDAHFPAINPGEWRLDRELAHAKSADDEASFRFLTYSRR